MCKKSRKISSLPKPLDNLKVLNGGLSKQWIWNNREYYYKSCNCLQKISYCIQDLNNEIEKLENPSMKDVVYVISLVDWICEAVEQVPKLITKGLLNDFEYSRQDDINTAKKYLRALRSFVVAHPLTTNRHEEFGFDGDKICVDIRGQESTVMRLLLRDEEWYYLSFDGLSENTKENNTDYIMYIYSASADNMKFFKYIGASFSDIYKVAEIYIDKLYSIDKFVSKLKKKNI